MAAPLPRGFFLLLTMSVSQDNQAVWVTACQSADPLQLSHLYADRVTARQQKKTTKQEELKGCDIFHDK